MFLLNCILLYNLNFFHHHIFYKFHHFLDYVFKYNFQFPYVEIHFCLGKLINQKRMNCVIHHWALVWFQILSQYWVKYLQKLLPYNTIGYHRVLNTFLSYIYLILKRKLKDFQHLQYLCIVSHLLIL